MNKSKEFFGKLISNLKRLYKQGVTEVIRTSESLVKARTNHQMMTIKIGKLEKKSHLSDLAKTEYLKVRELLPTHRQHLKNLKAEVKSLKLIEEEKNNKIVDLLRVTYFALGLNVPSKEEPLTEIERKARQLSKAHQAHRNIIGKFEKLFRSEESAYQYKDFVFRSMEELKADLVERIRARGNFVENCPCLVVKPNKRDVESDDSDEENEAAGSLKYRIRIHNEDDETHYTAQQPSHNQKSLPSNENDKLSNLQGSSIKDNQTVSISPYDNYIKTESFHGLVSEFGGVGGDAAKEKHIREAAPDLKKDNVITDPMFEIVQNCGKNIDKPQTDRSVEREQCLVKIEKWHEMQRPDPHFTNYIFNSCFKYIDLDRLRKASIHMISRIYTPEWTSDQVAVIPPDNMLYIPMQCWSPGDDGNRKHPCYGITAAQYEQLSKYPSRLGLYREKCCKGASCIGGK